MASSPRASNSDRRQPVRSAGPEQTQQLIEEKAATPVPRRVRRPPVEVPRGNSFRNFWLSALIVTALSIPLAQALEAPSGVPRALGLVVGCLLVMGISERTGGRPFAATVVAVATSVAVFLIPWEPLIPGAAVAVAVLGACTAVMITVPARSFPRACLEVLIALLVAAKSALAVQGVTTEVEPVRFGYIVLFLSLLCGIALIYRLGAGLQGLGRRGYVIAGIALALLIIAMAYTEALRTWGSADMNSALDAAQADLLSTIGGIPRPLSFLLGIPALAWGTYMRARRRQGWWVCAFGAAATAPITYFAIQGTDLSLTQKFLSEGYTLLLGLVIAFLVIRIETLVVRGRGSRKRRAPSSSALRPEPARFQPLH